jgi:CRP/FNR family transcriptional regulator
MAGSLAVLSRHPYFAPLPPRILAAVRTRVLTRSYDKGTLIYAEGDPSQGLYLVASGSVRIFKSSAEGREQDLHHLGPGESFSDAAAFDGQPTIANAQPMEESVILLVPREALRELMMQYPEIGLSATRVLATRVRALSTLAGELSLRHVVARVAGVIARQPAADSVVTLPAHHDLAATVGTVREVATRALRYLQRLGAIRLEPRRRVRILDRRLLDQFTGTLPGAALSPRRRRS